MALVDHDEAVAGECIVRVVVASEALDHGYVDDTAGPSSAPADLADLRCVETEERTEARTPLVE